MSTPLDLDSFEPVEEIVVQLSNYNFDSSKKTIVKRKAKKREIELYEKYPLEDVLILDKSHLNDEEFTKETIDVLGDFDDANKWSICNLTTKLIKENKLVAEL